MDKQLSFHEWTELIDPAKFDEKMKAMQTQEENLKAAMSAYDNFLDIEMTQKKTRQLLDTATKEAAAVVAQAEVEATTKIASATAAEIEAIQLREAAAVTLQEVRDMQSKLTTLVASTTIERDHAVEAKNEARAIAADVEQLKQELTQRLDKIKSVMQ